MAQAVGFIRTAAMFFLPYQEDLPCSSNNRSPNASKERVGETLQLRKSLFAGVFDSPTDEISFAKLARKTVLQTAKEIFAEQPGRPKPAVDQALPESIRLQHPPTEPSGPLPPPGAPVSELERDTSTTSETPASNSIEAAAASFLEAGLKLLESFTAGSDATSAPDASAKPLQQALSGLFSLDPRTNRPALTIPLPESVTQERLAGVFSSFLRTLGQAVNPAAEMENRK